MKITNLKVEYRRAPLGVGVARPRFSWQLQSEKRGAKQIAYRLQVRKGDSPAWDSGRVESDRCFGVRCGQALAPCTAYTWKVTVFTAEEEESACASFETGFFGAEDWGAGWVTAKGPDGPMYYRAEFTVQAPLKEARFSMASTTGAHGNKAYIMNLLLVKLNGEKPNTDVMFPGQLSPDQGRALYQRYDVTALLREGTNVLTAVSLSQAWSALLELTYADGTKEAVPFDSYNLRAADRGPYTLWEPFTIDQGGKTETYDTRAEHRDWEQPDFDMSGWKEAPAAEIKPVLSEQAAPAEIIEEKLPVKLWRNCYSRWVADYGENLHGFVRLTVNGKKVVRKIAVRYAEEVYPDGELNARSSTNFSCGELGPQTDVYIPRGEEREVFAPSFALHGFRYAEFARYPGGEPTADAVTACVVHSPILKESSFHCSDEQINRLFEISHRSQRMNLVTIPTDCPHRERLGWLGDALCLAESECINFDVLSLMESFMQVVADDQYPSGNVRYISPRPDNSGEGVDIPWAAACVMLPWYTYDVYGDAAILERYFPVMERWLAYLEEYKGSDGILHGGVKWNDHTARVKMEPDFIGTLFYYLGLIHTAKAAEVLGKETDHAALAQDTKEALIRTYWNGSGFGDNLQGDNAHALNLGLAEGEKEEQTLTTLLERIEEEDGFVTCGCLGLYHLIPALAERGQNDCVFALCKDTRVGSWGGWVEHYGATTSFEYLDATKGGSRNHPFLMGSITTWFYEHLLGIKRTAPGFKTFRVKPYFAEGMTFARGSVETLYGVIHFGWEKEGGQIRYRLEVPCGTEAAVFAPDGTVKTVGSGTYEMNF
ncbi:MAG: family 78 glycoside hydrolase catalytic domain [Clostridia bacterium]|nr:family 78 glycoside hydrolase catalytic domain [Clostridia bacterium]